MTQLKSYCDRSGKRLVAQHVTNAPYFAALGWMHFQAPDSFVYEPPQALNRPPSTNVDPAETGNMPPDWGQASPDEQQHDLQWGNDGRGLGPD